jgi:hypothetical protein
MSQISRIGDVFYMRRLSAFSIAMILICLFPAKFLPFYDSIPYTYKTMRYIEEVPFENLESGGILPNIGEIIVKKNLQYLDDKVVEIKSLWGIHSFEVENDNGKSKVVTVFLNDKEVVFQ